jgi:D-sedoheptulose 7-phosphate isomerase
MDNVTQLIIKKIIDKMKIQQAIQSSVDVKLQIMNNSTFLEMIEKVSEVLYNALKQGHKVLFCGNGGSAADAQHLAAELSGRFYFDRDPLPSEALHCNSSFLTAVANDYGFDFAYARLVKGSGQEGDVLVGLSTSGNSTNIVKAFEEAKTKGMLTIGMTGSTGGKLKDVSDYLLNVPSNDTPRIQESHILIGHILCEIVEERLFGKK